MHFIISKQDTRLWGNPMKKVSRQCTKYRHKDGDAWTLKKSCAKQFSNEREALTFLQERNLDGCTIEKVTRAYK